MEKTRVAYGDIKMLTLMPLGMPHGLNYKNNLKKKKERKNISQTKIPRSLIILYRFKYRLCRTTQNKIEKTIK